MGKPTGFLEITRHEHGYAPVAQRVQAVHQVFRGLAGVRAVTLAEVSTTRVSLASTLVVSPARTSTTSS